MPYRLAYFTCLLLIVFETKDFLDRDKKMSKDCSGVQQVSKKLETVTLTKDKDGTAPVVR